MNTLTDARKIRLALLVSIAAASCILSGACAQQPATQDAETVETTSSTVTGEQPTPQGATDAVKTTDSAPAKTTKPGQPPAPTYEVVQVPAGTEIELELIDTLSSGTSQAGDVVRARLARDLVARGRSVAPAGADVWGTVTEVVPLKKFGGQPRLALAFERISVEGGVSVPVSASLVQEGKKQAGRDAAKIGGGAAAGAVLGHQIDDDKGKVIGAIVGGAIGTAVAAKTGKEVELAAGTTVVVALENDLEVRVKS